MVSKEMRVRCVRCARSNTRRGIIVWDLGLLNQHACCLSIGSGVTHVSYRINHLFHHSFSLCCTDMRYSHDLIKFGFVIFWRPSNKALSSYAVFVWFGGRRAGQFYRQESCGIDCMHGNPSRGCY